MQSTTINMQRKPGFPVANCSIKMPEILGSVISELGVNEEDSEQQQRRLQLINFGHSQWGFNNWSWAVTKQELDFIELTNGKYCAGVVAYVSITVKSFDIHRENIGYATSNANNKGFAIYKSRKCAVTNALRETLLSFGGTVATDLLELLETNKSDITTPAPTPASAPPSAPAPAPAPESSQENNQNIANKQAEPKNSVNNLAAAKNIKEGTPAHNQRHHAGPRNSHVGSGPRSPPPVGRAHPMSGPRAPLGAPPPPRPGAPPRAPSNVSFVLQPVMGGAPLYGARPPLFPNYYEYAGPWHLAYEPHHGNVNLNFNIPPKNLVVNSRAGSVECRNACREGEPVQYAQPQAQGCWIKPTIFYDGFWTEQKVKKWVAEQVEKQFPDDPSRKPATPGDHSRS